MPAEAGSPALAPKPSGRSPRGVRRSPGAGVRPPPAVGASVLAGAGRRWRFALIQPAAGAELPWASERGSQRGGRHAASLCSLRQIISYLETLPPRQSPLTSFTQPKRLETTAADVWLLNAARHIGTTAPAAAGETPHPRPQKALL